MSKIYIAVDQYNRVHGPANHIRKYLLEHYGGSISKMYRDGEDGRPVQVGYVVGGKGGLWCNVYEVTPMVERITK